MDYKLACFTRPFLSLIENLTLDIDKQKVAEKVEETCEKAKFSLIKTEADCVDFIAFKVIKDSAISKKIVKFQGHHLSIIRDFVDEEDKRSYNIGSLNDLISFLSEKIKSSESESQDVTAEPSNKSCYSESSSSQSEDMNIDYFGSFALTGQDAPASSQDCCSYNELLLESVSQNQVRPSSVYNGSRPEYPITEAFPSQDFGTGSWLFDQI